MATPDSDHGRLLASIRRLRLHQHICVIYETRREQLEVAVPFIRDGLDRREKCLYISTGKSVAAVFKAVRAQGIKTKALIRTGSLGHVRFDPICLKEGRFVPGRLFPFLHRATQQARKEGFAAFRWAGEPTWALRRGDGAKRLIDFEVKLNGFLQKHEALCICQYDRSRYPSDVILKVMLTHPVVIYRNLVCKNPYYIPPDEFQKPKASKEVERFLHNLLALERAEDRIRLIIDTIPTMAWSVRPDGAVDFVNQRWMDYTGLSLEEEIEEPTRAIHPEDLPRVLEKWRSEMAAGEAVEDEMRLRRADGEYRWFLVRTAPLRDERGSIVKWYGTSVDIEDRKRAEMESRSLIDAIPHQIWSGPPDGSIDYCNDRWRSETGLGLEDLRGDGWQRILHPEDRDRVLRAWRESVKNGTPYEQEERHRFLDGTYRWFLSRGVPLKDPAGRIVRWYGTNTDIEDRKDAETRLRLVIDTTPGLLHSGRPDGYLDFFNKPWLDYVGLSLEEVRGWGWTSTIHPGDVDEMVHKWRSSLASGEPFEAEARVRRADGEYRWLLHRKVPLRDEAGNIVKWFGSSIDIEDQKRAEEALRRLSGQLLRSQDEERRRIARELHDSTGQKLTALLMMLGSLKERIATLDPQSRRAFGECLALAKESVRELSSLTHLLHPPMLEQFGLVLTLRWLVREFSRRSGIAVSLKVPSQIEHLPRDMATTLFRVVQEGLGNVQQHSGSKKAQVRLALNKKQVVLEVRDFGHGIEIPSAKKRPRGGRPLGVGIAGMRERVQQFGGELRISSSGNGTALKVTLPIKTNAA